MFHQDNGLTPLMLAARDGKHNIVEKLLDLGAVVPDLDNVSRTQIRYTKKTNIRTSNLNPNAVMCPTEAWRFHFFVDLP